MVSKELRERFLDYFAERGHKILPSSSLIPKDDPTLLLTGAGMVPFKPYFLGKLAPPTGRVTTCQRCLRTADIDNVGKTARHATFFEMLGNFSFGDYFKEEAIAWAWKFVTKDLGLSMDRLWVTIYLNDDEAFSIWNGKIGVPEDRIVRLGKEDNFWEIGVGPCGPCSEIHVDRGPGFGCGRPGCSFGCTCDRFMEIWNLVFIQFHRDEEGNYHPLDRKGIDTGMGLERACTVLQGVSTIYDIDLIKPLILKLADIARRPYGESSRSALSMRIIADHMRGVTFLASDGVTPSNEGRGYILRRLLRRAARHGRLLGIDRVFLPEMSETIMSVFQDVYPEVNGQRDHILKVIAGEEERFYTTLDQGIEILGTIVTRLKRNGETVMPGVEAFKLYDTYGFPYELTSEILSENGLTVEEQGFWAAMEEQRERARAARQGGGYLGDETGASIRFLGEAKTEFVGYNKDECPAKVMMVLREGKPVDMASAGDHVEFVLDRTPFYGESGGQAGDTGTVLGKDKDMDMEVKVTGATRPASDVVLHHGEIIGGILRKGDEVVVRIDGARRKSIARNHTATHLLHKALREVFGEHVRQAGSLVAEDRLRFDFSHGEAVAMEELAEVEARVNRKVLENIRVDVFLSTLEEATKAGAVALFGEKYGDIVRVVKIGEYSSELCGGTHLDRTGEIGLFKILGEGSIASGIRRIEAVTGEGALHYVRENEDLLRRVADKLRASPEEAPEKLEGLLSELKDMAKQLAALKGEKASSQVDDLLPRVEHLDGLNVLVSPVEGLGPEELRGLGDTLKDRLRSGIVVLGSRLDDRVAFVVSVTRDLVGKLHAGEVAREVAKVAGGGGGGRPDMAQAGGKNVDKLDEALDRAREVIRGQAARSVH